ncbi:MAG: nucleotidyltransferase domain-containing protein [bacterium]
MNWRIAITYFKERLKNIYQDNLKEVVLYGSAVRGELKDGSDVDLLVILENYEDFWEEFHTINDLAYKISAQHNFQILISAFPITSKKYLRTQTPLLINVREEGRPV